MAKAQRGPYIPELIREARGLNGDEKVFLYDVHSHESHEEFAARPTVRARTGLSERKLRRVVAVLNRLGLVASQERPGETTKHVLRVAALSSYSQKSRHDPGVATALVKKYRSEVASTAAASTVSVGSGSQVSKTPVHGGPTGADQSGPSKKNPSKEELETINKNLKARTKFGQALGTRGVSDLWVDAYVEGQDIE